MSTICNLQFACGFKALGAQSMGFDWIVAFAFLYVVILEFLELHRSIYEAIWIE